MGTGVVIIPRRAVACDPAGWMVVGAALRKGKDGLGWVLRGGGWTAFRRGVAWECCGGGAGLGGMLSDMGSVGGVSTVNVTTRR